MTIGVDRLSVQGTGGQRIGAGNFGLFVFPVGPRRARSSSKHVRNFPCRPVPGTNQRTIARINSGFF
jgi:hypothetical protein